tara:strand:- start:1709 stop:1873 length:165 start_codon:yes stop_codon:yes gene_type:complete
MNKTLITIPLETNLDLSQLLEIVHSVILGELGDAVFDADPGCHIDEDDAAVEYK